MERISHTIGKVINKLAEDLYGITLIEAHEKGICLSCRQPALPNCRTTAGVREYAISGLCERCFDAIGE